MWLNIFLALLAGAAVPFQAAANARIAAVSGHPLWGALVNVLGALLILGAAALAWRPGHPAGLLQAGPTLPGWAWLGGAFGVVYLLGLTALGPRLGSVTLLGLIVLGQLLAASVLEHLGALGLPAHALSPGRLLGLALLVAGVVLVRRF